MTSYERQATKARTKVKPMLRKLTQSEKNSLDLDRPAELQNGLGIYDYGSGSRSTHEVNYRNESGRRAYHARSTSGTSQFSTATGGSHRAGSFVHPFQQTPRPYTPPISAASYQNSLRESDRSNSPVPTDDDDRFRPNYRSASNLSNGAGSITGSSTASPIVSQPLRLQTTSKQPSSSRLALATSHTSLHSSVLLSPVDIGSPTDTMSPTSAFRSSIDKGFRLRSRSDVVNRTHAQQIADARRKFQEKEQAKEERAARAEIAALEKRQRQEARQIERGHRRSSAGSSTTAKPKLGARGRSETNLASEKVDSFVGRDYGSAPLQAPPALNELYAGPKRQHTAMGETKKKTNSAWHKLMMWIRTRFIRMGGNRKRSRSEAGVF